MHFGVLGTAGIARSATIPAIQASEHTVQAIASRDQDRAAAVAADAGIPDACGSYEELLAADDVDAVYVPLPNALHGTWTKAAADAGLHVLCEKPLAATATEAREMVEHCAERGVTLMEAFMYRYHPRTSTAPRSSTSRPASTPGRPRALAARRRSGTWPSSTRSGAVPTAAASRWLWTSRKPRKN